MTLSVPGIGVGIELDNLATIIPLTGTPGGGLSGTIAIGSIGLSDNGNIYRKATAGTGADKWSVIGSVDQISWREPALVKEDTNYASLAAAETAMNTGTVDGETVAEFNRILYTDIDGENKNVFIINGTVGSGATLVEDNNVATINDIIAIDEGTFEDQVFSFNGAEWVTLDAAVLAELTNIRAYTGKPTAGAVLPQYTSERVVTINDAQTVAISKLDNVSNVANTITAIVGGVTTVIDTVLVDDIRGTAWQVTAVDTTNNNTEYHEIKGLNNGRGGTDAANVNGVNTNNFRTTSKISGLEYDVTLTGSGVTQAMNLTFVADNAADVTVMRNGYTKTT